MTEPRKTTRTDKCKLWAHPEYVQQIKFEGCDVLAVAPEDYSALFEHARALEIETQELAETLGDMVSAYGVFSCGICENAHKLLARHRAKQEGSK